MGRAAPSAERRGVTPWTRARVRAWVHEFDYLPTGESRVIRVARTAIVRLCPEAPDYDDLAGQIGCQLIARDLAGWTDEEIAASVADDVARLWAHALSDEPSRGGPA